MKAFAAKVTVPVDSITITITETPTVGLDMKMCISGAEFHLQQSL